MPLAPPLDQQFQRRKYFSVLMGKRMSEHAALASSRSRYFCLRVGAGRHVWSRIQSIAAVQGGEQQAFVTWLFSASQRVRGGTWRQLFCWDTLFFSISCCCVLKKEGKRVADSLQTASLCSPALLVAVGCADEYLVTTTWGQKMVLVLYLGFRAPDAGG